MAKLDRVTDPSALDACAGARARLAVDVPAGWLLGGADLTISAPLRLACARCDGGGCDGCERSGALRAPEDPAMRVLHARLPAMRDASAAVALRIPAPFGEDHPIAQLLVEVRAAAAPSALVRRVDSPLAIARATPPAPRVLMVAAALVALALALASIFAR